MPEPLGTALGVLAVVLGLAFFIEGLLLGVMPLGETCREGELEDLVAAAMAAGTGGATMRRLRSLSLPGAGRPMESSDLIIPSRLVERVHRFVTEAGTAGSHSGWTAEVSEVEGVISYLYG